MEKRLILAIALSVFIIFIFQVILGKKRPVQPAVTTPTTTATTSEAMDTGVVQKSTIPRKAVREIETNNDLGLLLVGFMDDNPRLHNRKVKGYPVLGGQEDLEKILEKYKIKKVIVSFKKRGTEKRREIKALCLKKGAEIDVGQMKLIIS